MNSGDFCNKVVTIPQYVNTCWFNSILMALLYSQHSRKLLLHDNIYEKQKSTNKLYNVINNILLDNYISQEKAMKYYDILKPEKIIGSYLPDITQMNKKFMVLRGWFFYIYLPKFLTVLGKTCMTLDRYKDDYYINLLKIFEYYKQSLVGNNVMIQVVRDYEKVLEEKGNPDYLIVNLLLDNNTDYSTEINYMMSQLQTESIFRKDPKLSSENMKLRNSGKRFKGLENLENVIEYNGDTYVLDSCLLTNYNNNTRGNHAICGITCKNNRYVYNGWMRTTNDPAIVDKSLFKNDNMPCELMKFEWDVSNPRNKFCLNPARCQLPTIDKTVNTDLCFSFGKGKRSLIYVKINKDFKSLNDTLKSSLKKTDNDSKKTDKDAKKTDKDVKKKECPEGKVLNPLTGRCINIKKTNKDAKKTDKDVKKTDKDVKKKECPEGKVLNPLTGRCIKIKKTDKDAKKTDKDVKKTDKDVKKTDKDSKKKKCPEGKVLNPLTGRCINIKKTDKDVKKTDKDVKKTDKDVKKTDKDSKKKKCPEGKVLNPLTGRCINIKKTDKDAKKTDKDTKKTDKDSKKKKECPEGKVLNPLTGRCIKKK